MKTHQLKALVLAALFAALTAAATLVLQIPTPAGGYVNPGDALVLLGAWLLGPLPGAAAAGIGSMLADLLSGYALYAPGTLCIKAAMALAAGLLWRALAGKPSRPRLALAARLCSAAAGEAVMVLGYFAYEALLLQNGLGAAAGIPANLLQAAFGLIAAVLLAPLLERARRL